MLTGLLGGLVIGLLLARSGRAGGWPAARVSAATVGGLAGGAMLLSGTAGRWVADLSPTAPVPGSLLDLAVACAGASLLLVAMGLATRHPVAGLLTAAAGLAASLAGMALLDAVAAPLTGPLVAGGSTGALGAAVRGAVLAGTGMVLLGAGVRALCAEHAQRWAPAGRVLQVATRPPARDRLAVETACELAA